MLKRLLGGAACAVAGAFLLVLVAPHRNPWDPVWVVDLTRRAGMGPRTLSFGLLGLALACGVATVTAALRRGSIEPRTARRAIVVLLATLATLVPAGERGAAVVSALLLGAGGVALAALAVRESGIAERLAPAARAAVRAVERVPGRFWAAACALVVLAGAGVACHGLAGRVPHVVDAAVQLFHAKVLLSGATWTPVPEPFEPFRMTHMVATDGRWYSQYPPGHPLLLALGLLVGAPWLVDPVLGAATGVLVYLLAAETHGVATARIAAALWALSPFVWLTSASFMSHAPAGFFLTLFLLGFVRAFIRGGAFHAALAGVAVGCALAVRPWTAAAFAAPCGAWAVARFFGATRRGSSAEVFTLLRRGALLAAGLALPVAGLAAFNAATTGSPFVFGYEAAGRDALPGLGARGFWERPHTLRAGIAALADNLNALNQYLFGLPLPSLVLPLAGVVAGRRRVWDRLFMASAASLALAHVFYWYHDWTYGPRFLYETTSVLVVLSAGALHRLGAAARETGALAVPLRRFAACALVLGLVYAWTVRVPVFAGFYSRNYADGNASVVRAVEAGAAPGAVVLVPGRWYVSVFPMNEAALDGAVVYARDQGPGSARALAAAYEGRPFYRVRSLDRYVLEPYRPAEDDGSVVWPLRSGERWTVEALTFQVSHLAAEQVANQPTGEWGEGWLNHDELRIASEAPGSEVGFVLAAPRAERRTLVVAFSRSPTSGAVEVSLNGRALGPPVDLWSERPRPSRTVFEGVELQEGWNGLLFRVVSRGPAAAGYELGLDYIALE